jgi:hypothetical protein
MKSILIGMWPLYIIVSLINISFFYSFKKPVIKQPIKTYASIVQFKNVGADAVYQYIVNDKSYQFWGYSNPSLVLGDRFEMIYDKSNPKKNKLLAHRPIFTKDEQTSIIRGRVTKIVRINKEMYFQYVVNGFLYTRIQKIERPKKWNDLVFKLGNEYKVEYWVENPRRAIIHPN